MLAFLGQTFNRAVIVSSSYTNSAAYAKNCVNKAKPMLHCNGKCQMLKKMKQEENNDKQNPERRGNPDEVLSSKSYFISLKIIQVSDPKHFAQYISIFPENRSADFFHPPTA